MAQALATTETAARAAVMPAPADREQAIREAAYALFEARGGEPGHELDDWLKAEAQVLGMPGASASTGTAGPLAH